MLEVILQILVLLVIGGAHYLICSLIFSLGYTKGKRDAIDASNAAITTLSEQYFEKKRTKSRQTKEKK